MIKIKCENFGTFLKIQKGGDKPALLVHHSTGLFSEEDRKAIEEDFRRDWIESISKHNASYG
jgi:hypothetical protein